MRVLVGAKVNQEYRRFTRELRSQDLTRGLQRRLDVRARETVASLADNPVSGRYILADGIVMVFSSEPDVAFLRGELLEATIEIKGGIDPAGALERLGAAEKSAQAAIGVNTRCKNFLVAGVITAEMRGSVPFQVVWLMNPHSGESRRPQTLLDSGFRRNDEKVKPE